MERFSEKTHERKILPGFNNTPYHGLYPYHYYVAVLRVLYYTLYIIIVSVLSVLDDRLLLGARDALRDPS